MRIFLNYQLLSQYQLILAGIPNGCNEAGTSNEK
jgi:hypothetical protein